LIQMIGGQILNSTDVDYLIGAKFPHIWDPEFPTPLSRPCERPF
jgi:hypothetical protein